MEYVPGLTEVPLSLVTLWDNHGVNFEGCTFKDETNLNQYHKNVANGIYSIDATYQVLAYCNYPPNTVPTSPCPASFVVPSSFTNFNQGVYATGAAGMRTVTVDQTDFIDNSMGVRVEGLDNVRFTRNTVLTGGVVKSGYSSQPGFSTQVGYYSQDASGYEVEENTFEERSQSVEDVAGIMIKNSGTSANQTYHNTFKNNVIGQLFVGENRNSTNAYEGLQFICNTNPMPNTKDVIIRDDPFSLNPSVEGIRSYQGTSSLSAGNVFSTTTSNHIENNSLNAVTYYHSGGIQKPTTYTVGLVIVPTTTSPANNCLPKYLVQGPSGVQLPVNMITEYYTKNHLYKQLLYTYKATIDGGDTEALLETIGLTATEEALQLRNELMAEAPYLSEEALWDAAASGTLTDAFLLEVALANPDATRNEAFLDFVELEIPNPLPASMVQLIYLNWDAETPRTILEHQLGDYTSELGRMSSQIIHYYSTDTLNHKDSIESILKSNKSIASKYQLVEMAVINDNFVEANLILTGLEQQGLLPETKLAEHNNLKSYVLFRDNLAAEGIDYMQLDESKLVELRLIAAAETGRSSNLAKNILCFGYDECDFGSASQARKKTRRVYDMTVDPSASSGLSIEISPNPANEFVKINIKGLSQGESLQFKLLTAEGKVILDESLKNETTQLNISKFNKGVYLYQIRKKNEIISTDKLILQ